MTERPGRLRIVRNDVLDPTPIAGVPRVRTDGNGGLKDVALHPRFADRRPMPPLTPTVGTRLGSYEIPSALGTGGMRG